MLKRFAALFAVVAAVTFASNTSIASPKAEKVSITITTVAEPPAEAGIDRSTLREATEEAARSVDTKDLKRSVTIALSLIKCTNDPTANCVISLAVQDKKKGTILGAVTGSAQASAAAKGDQRERIARLALSNAMNRVPDVVVGSK
jgi:hypothetical protein